MSQYAVRVSHLGKQYQIGQSQGRYKSLRESLTNAVRAPIQKWLHPSSQAKNFFWALDDVNFEIQHGEAVGIIGRNGAGKSTLLKILARITDPTRGEIRLRGRVGSLLEVGTGFHPELTGRENIFLNGAILGMSRSEIQRKFDEIVDFAEIEKFIDTPAKHYSSGMYMRLAFSVAAHLEPEILLVDEVLAVGDAQFQKKCLGKMGEVTNEGRTVLFVSHNIGAIENFCKKSILLENGNIALFDTSSFVINFYLRNILPNILDNTLSTRKDRRGNGKVILTNFHIEDMENKKIANINCGMDVFFVFEYMSKENTIIRNVDIGFSVITQQGQTLFVLYSSYQSQTFTNPPTIGTFRCLINRFPLKENDYIIDARVVVNGEESDYPQNGVGIIQVKSGDFYRNGNLGFDGNVPFLVEGDWSVENR